MSKDLLGDSLKAQEQIEAGRRADPSLPLMARIDGKCFSKFTQNLQRPFDERFVRLMVETTKYLVEQSEALLGYCQSDEITLFWYLDKENYSNREFWFNGKYQKVATVLASTAGSFFTSRLPDFLPEKVGEIPVFDARAWSVPDIESAYLNFIWRYRDARKNSVSMYARTFFPHSSLQGKSCNEMKGMLSFIGKSWDNLPTFFKDGTYVKRQRVMVSPEDVRMGDIPERWRPKDPIFRSTILEFSLREELSLDKFTEISLNT